MPGSRRWRQRDVTPPRTRDARECRSTQVDALRPHAQKLRVVLNKADQVTPQQLLRVYGALMWQLGRVVSTPEVVRVHLGSFWDRPLDHRRGSDTALLSRERDDLLDELRNLPKNAVLRRINELSRRARKLKVHCYLIHYLRKQMPQFFGKEEKQQKLLADLPRQFAKCANRYGLTRGDFPDVDDFREALLEIDDLSKFPEIGQIESRGNGPHVRHRHTPVIGEGPWRRGGAVSSSTRTRTAAHAIDANTKRTHLRPQQVPVLRPESDRLDDHRARLVDAEVHVEAGEGDAVRRPRPRAGAVRAPRFTPPLVARVLHHDLLQRSLGIIQSVRREAVRLE